jgi:hypothetical protein
MAPRIKPQGLVGLRHCSDANWKGKHGSTLLTLVNNHLTLCTSKATRQTNIISWHKPSYTLPELAEAQPKTHALPCKHADSPAANVGSTHGLG